MKLDSQQNKIVKELSQRHNLTREEIIEIVHSPFKFIRKEIKETEFNGEESEEEFNNKVKNFNIPSICKLYGSYYNFKSVNNGRKNSIKKGKDI